jgi:hypothetical protein
MELTKEEQVFLRLLMRDAWYDCDMRNKGQSERKLFLQIQSKLSMELIHSWLKQQHQNKQKLLSQNYPTGSPEMDGFLITVS